MTGPRTTAQRVFARQRILQVTPEGYRAGVRLLAEAAQQRHGPITAVIGIAHGGLAPAQALGALLAAPTYRIDAQHNPTDALYTQASGHVSCDLHAPRGALLYPQRSWEELEGRFLGPMAYLDAKARGDSSLPEKQWLWSGV